MVNLSSDKLGSHEGLLVWLLPLPVCVCVSVSVCVCGRTPVTLLSIKQHGACPTSLQRHYNLELVLCN